MMRDVCFALMLAALANTALAQTATPGQTTRTPPRDPRAATTPTGSGIIRGQVVDATTGAPIRRATVSTFAADFRGGRPSVLTDDNGRFELTELSPGKYPVSASKSTYVGSTYGQTRARGPGTPIELADKQVVEKIVIKLSRGGVIVGRVMDEAGEPVPEVSVQPMQYRYGPQGRTLSGAGSGGWNRTDDLGTFRIYGLEPGQYYVTARPNEFAGSFGAPPAGMGPATTYFPNAPDPSTAQRVTVATGRETGPVIITLVSTRLSRVRGRALMSDGQPFVNASVRVTVNDDGGTRTHSGSTTAGDGSFEVRSLPPGTFHLSIVPMGSNSGEDGEIARATLTVNGDDIDGLLLVAGRTGVVRGRITTDDGSPIVTTGMTVSPTPPTPTERVGFMPPGRVREDQTFEIKGLYGPQLFRAYTPPQQSPGSAPWMLKSVMLNNADIIDKPLDFQPGMVIEGVELVFTQKAAELSGNVTISGRATFDDTLVVLFPNDETLWRDSTRFVRAARPDKDGTYRFRMIPAHDDYLLVTAVGLEPGQYMDPDFLRGVRDGALRVSLADAEKKIQNIRVSTLP